MPWIGSTSIFGMLRAAAAKPVCSSAPSMISALVSPSPENCDTRALVLASLSCAFSITRRPPSLALPARVVTFSSISRALLLGRSLGRLHAVRHLELAGFRSFLRQRLLHCVTHRDPAALRTGHGTFDQDQAACDVSLHNAKIERRD